MARRRRKRRVSTRGSSSRKKVVIINDANLYLLDSDLDISNCDLLIDACKDNNKLECAISVSSRDASRNVNEVKCIGSDASYKVLGSISKAAFDAEVALTEDSVARRIYDAFDEKTSFIFVIEYLMKTGNYYEAIYVKVSKRVQSMNNDDIVKYTYTLEPYGTVKECKACPDEALDGQICYIFSGDDAWCVEDTGENLVIDSGEHHYTCPM